jgi:hypothetical protein
MEATASLESPEKRTGGERPTMSEITFKDFQRLILKPRRSFDDLVDIFRGKLDGSRAFFERVMSCQWRNPDSGRYEDRSDVVIPYRSVIEFYLKDSGKLGVWLLDFIEEFHAVFG